MSDARLDAIVASSDSSAQSLQWRYDTRPTNAPARRLWGGAKLLLDLDRHRLLARLAGRLIATRSVEEIERALVVRMGGETLVGVERAREIVINALLPTMLAAGVESGRRDLIEAACVAYRTAPSPASNEIVRGVAARFFHGREPEGAFMQQGMIEFHQRYRSSDRRALSFIAERGPRDYYPARA